MMHSMLHSEEEAEQESNPGSWSRGHAPNHYCRDELYLKSRCGVSH